MTKNQLNLALAVCLIAIAVILRILPHPANFAPVAAVALFGGAVLPKKVALLVPLLAMMSSDAIIGFHSLVAVTWSCYVLIALASSRWLRNGNFARGSFLTLSSSMFFFVVTNFAVWLTSGMYTHTMAGLVRCFSLALPFFRNTLLSDLFYASVMFGLYYLALEIGQKIAVRQSVQEL